MLLYVRHDVDEVSEEEAHQSVLGLMEVSAFFLCLLTDNTLIFDFIVLIKIWGFLKRDDLIKSHKS